MPWRFWRRRKASPRPTEPTDKSAPSPKPPISHPATNVSTTASSRQISIDDAGSCGPVEPPATAQQTPAPAPPPPIVENDGLASKTPLWIRAYDAICEDDPELVAAYKAVLSSELRPEAVCDTRPDGGDDAAENARQEMDRQVQEGLRRTENAAVKMDKIHEGMRVVSSVKELISKAAKHAPEAAVAWAGICLLFAILENPLNESKALREGIAHVVARMDWYLCLSKLLETTQAETTEIRDNLERHIRSLYKKLLLHQMKSICSFYRELITTIARDIIKLDDWADALQSLKDAETLVQQDINIFHGSEVRTLLNNISMQAGDRHARLQDIYLAIQEISQKQEERQQETDQRQEDRQQDERTIKCLTELRLTDPRDDMQRIADMKGGLFREASDWILSSNDFRRWHSANDGQLLWIKGNPGKGKTMLMITIVEELERQRPATSSTALSYFFCQGTDENLNNAAAVLRGLIYILCHQQPSLASHLRARYDHAGIKLFQDANSFYALAKVLENILQDEQLQRVYLVVDALDECMADRDQLLRFIAGHGMASRAKWIVSSRNIPKIENLLKLDGPRGSPGSEVRLSLEVTQNADQVALAVSAFIDHRLSTIESLREDHKTRGEIRKMMREKADGTFLWVALVFDELQETDSWDMLEVLRELPEKLEGLYDRMIQQIRNYKRKTPEFCWMVLSTATLAYRPLYLDELAIVSGLPAEISDYANRVQEVVDLCGSFLTIKADVVYLIHQSVKDYLTGRAGQIFPFGLKDAHHAIFLRSLQAMTILHRDIYDLHYPGSLISELKTPDPDPLAAIRYPCAHWIDHFCACDRGRCMRELIDDGSVLEFFEERFLYWLESLSLLGKLSDSVPSIKRLLHVAKSQANTSPRLIALLKDAERFVLSHRSIIERAPLQAYSSALVFSPTMSIVRRIYWKENLSRFKTVIGIRDYWGADLQTLEGHSDAVMALAFSPDGKTLASASQDHTIRLWDATTGASQQSLEGHNDSVSAVAFSPDSQVVASASHDHTVRLWDTGTGANRQTLEGHSNAVCAVAFSPHQKMLASGSYDHTVQLWDASTGTHLQTLKGHSSSVSAVVFSPDSKTLASASHDHTVRLWDTVTGIDWRSLKGHSDWVCTVAFSPDGKTLASGSFDHTVRLWDAVTGVGKKTLEGHSSWVQGVAFSPDGKTLVSAPFNQTIRLWDAVTGAYRQTIGERGCSVREIAFSPDSKTLASTSHDCTVQLWDATIGTDQQMHKMHSDVVCAIAFSPNGKTLASASYDHTVQLWDAATGTHLQTLKGHGSLLSAVAFSPDGKMLVSASEDCTVRLWDAETGAHQQTLEGHSDCVRAVAFSPDSKTLASASLDHTVRLWDAATGTHQQMLKGHSSWVNAVAFSSDSKTLASASYDQTIRLWDTVTGTDWQMLKGHSDIVSAVSFSPDGKTLASASHGHTVWLWDIMTGVCRQTLEWHSGWVGAMAFSEDSRYLETNRGLLSVISNADVLNTSRDWEQARRILFVGDEWVTQDGKDLLWLPPKYRATYVAVCDGILVLGHATGQMTFLYLDIFA